MRRILYITTTFFITFLVIVPLTSSSIEDGFPSSNIIGKDTNYTVKKGDSLKKIASRFDITAEELVKTNKLRNANVINPGQKLRISTKTIVPKKIDKGLIINLPEYKIYHFEFGRLFNTYDIAIGKKNWRTPRGKFEIANKTLNPTWRVPPGMARKLKIKKSSVPPGPSNPLGKYWIGLSLPHIGIHSTNQPRTIGKAKSHGCMRMESDKAKKLFNDVNVGTPGEIIYQPVKIAQSDGSIFLEVHHDIYGLFPNIYSHALSLLSKEGLKNKVDIEVVKKAVEEKRGSPVKIGHNYVNTGYTKFDFIDEKVEYVKQKAKSYIETKKKSKSTQKESSPIWGSSYSVEKN